MKQPRPTIGAVALCYNESENLPGFFSTLLPWVDEIVIVDDGSTDDSAAVAAAAGSKIRFIVDPRKPGEGFNHQRNKGIGAAVSDWLLHLDIDERVTPEMASEILEAIQDPAKDGYRYYRLNFFLNRPMKAGGHQLWNAIHLARRDKLIFEPYPLVHERELLEAPADRIGQLKNRMWHLNEGSFSQRLEKNIRYSALEADKIVAAGKKVGWRHFVFVPAKRAIINFLWHSGFRDGVRGLIWSLYTFAGTLNWYVMAWEKQNPVKREEVEARITGMWEAELREESPDDRRY